MNKAIPLLENLVTVRFDSEEGQVIDLIAPSSTSLNDTIRTLIAYFSFPDSYVNTQEGKLFYSFQLSDGKPLFCYVLFSQKKDKMAIRGFQQSSLVLVSRWRLIELFKKLIWKVDELCENQDQELMPLFNDLLDSTSLEQGNDAKNLIVKIKETTINVFLNRATLLLL